MNAIQRKRRGRCIRAGGIGGWPGSYITQPNSSVPPLRCRLASKDGTRSHRQARAARLAFARTVGGLCKVTSRATTEQQQAGLGSAQQLIFGTGEMAELTRSFDWSKTPLGPMEQWPVALLTTVNMIISCRHPMVLFWGDDFSSSTTTTLGPAWGKTSTQRRLASPGSSVGPRSGMSFTPQSKRS